MVPISPENTELREFFVYKSHPAYYYVLVILGAASDATLDNDAPGFCSWGRSYLMVISIFETTTLYDKTVPAINMHIRNILADEELAEKINFPVLRDSSIRWHTCYIQKNKKT